MMDSDHCRTFSLMKNFIESCPNHQLVIATSDNEVIDARNLWIFSGYIRSMIGSLRELIEPVLIMPQFSSQEVRTGLKILEMSQLDIIIFDKGVRAFLETVGVNINKCEIFVKEEPREELESAIMMNEDDNEEKEKEELESIQQQLLSEEGNEQDTKREETEKENNQLELAIEETIIINNENLESQNTDLNYRNIENKGPSSVTCMFCEKEFYGTISKLKDKLKCHIGPVHYREQLQQEVDNFFGKNNVCKACGKITSNGRLQRKHLLFNHTRLCVEVLELVKDNLKSHQQPSNLQTEALLQSDESRSSTSANDDDDDEHVDKLLQSDDEEYKDKNSDEMDEMDDIQKMLLDENDSDEEDDTGNKDAIDSDDWKISTNILDDNEEDGLQNQLLMYNDLSDSDDDNNEEEEEKDREPVIFTEHQQSSTEKVTQFLLSQVQSEHKIQETESKRKLDINNINYKRRCKSKSDKDREIDERISEIMEQDANKFWCKQCGKLSSHRHDMMTHIEKHLEYKHPCSKCKKLFNTRKSLSGHKRTSHKSE